MHGSRQPVIVSRETKRPRFRLDARTAATHTILKLLVQVAVFVVRTGATHAEHVLIAVITMLHGVR